MKRFEYQLRLSAVSGIQSTLQILIVTAAMVPARAIIDRIFGSRRTYDWKAGLIVGCSLAILWYLAVCISTFVDIRRSLDRGRYTRQIFAASSFMTGLYGGTVLMAGALAIGMYSEGDPLWCQAIPLILLLIAFYGWPRSIHCDENEIWQRSKLGIKKRIAYNAVIAIAGAEGKATVTGAGGTIELTPEHADAEQFSELVAKRSGKPIY